MFDALSFFAAPRHDELCDEFSRYLNTDIETVDDVLLWWIEHRASFPCLSHHSTLNITPRLSTSTLLLILWPLALLHRLLFFRPCIAFDAFLIYAAPPTPTSSS